MRLKSYQQFEGLGSFIRRKFNKDETTAEGIFKKILSLKEIVVSHISEYLDDIYFFNIDGFDIKIKSSPTMDGFKLYLYVDGVILDVSSTICKKIFKKVYDIYIKGITIQNKEHEEYKEYIKKDAKINFSIKNH